MTFEELLDISYRSESRWIVYDGDERIFTGYVWELDDRLIGKNKQSTLYIEIKDRPVKSFRFHVDIRHKEWKERGLLKPLMPHETPDYLYSDLREDIYYEVHL